MFGVGVVALFIVLFVFGLFFIVMVWRVVVLSALRLLVIGVSWLELLVRLMCFMCYLYVLKWRWVLLWDDSAVLLLMVMWLLL